MSDDASQRLDELKLLWESDPSSKVYLQLASVYRQKGQLDEAVEVLETSLQHRPRDPRGRVALARCKMELKDHAAAAELLEEVIRQDAAHLEANKQLLECYLQIGEAEKAEERLGIYKLLNDRDPELDHLEYRLSSLQGGGEEADAAPIPVAEPAAPEPATPEPAAPESAAPETIPPEFESEPEPVALDVKADDEPQDSEDPPSGEAPSAPPAALDPEPVQEAEAEPLSEQDAQASPEAHIVEGEASTDDDLFDLSPEPESTDDDPWGGDLFDLAPPAQAAATPEETDLGGLWEQTEVVALDDDEIEEPTQEQADGEDSMAAREPDDADEAAVEETEAESADSATATLGLLYLKQGHLDEAEQIFRKVLSQDSENEAALAGLQQLETQRLAAAAQEAEAGEPSEEAAPEPAADAEVEAELAAESDDAAADEVVEASQPEPDVEPPAEVAEPEPAVASEPEAEPEPPESMVAAPQEEPLHDVASEGAAPEGAAPEDAAPEAEAEVATEAEPAEDVVPQEASADEAQSAEVPDETEQPAAPALTAQALLGRVALEGGMPGDATGRKVAVLQQYIQQIRTASGTHVH